MFEVLEGSVDRIGDGGTGEAVLIDTHAQSSGHGSTRCVSHEAITFGKGNEPFMQDVIL